MKGKTGYGFWEANPDYLAKMYARVEKDDLDKIAQETAKEIVYAIEGEANPSWLDIGSGDGITLSNILEYLKTNKFRLMCVEPDKFARRQLERRLKQTRTLDFTITPYEFSPDLVPENSFDAVTLLHSVYYLGRAPEDYQRLFDVLSRGLRVGGRIISLSVSSRSDFSKLGNPDYSEISLGDNLHTFLRQIGYKPSLKELRTRFDVTDFIRDPQRTAEEFKLFYQFVNQNTTIEWDNQTEEDFRRRVAELAVEQEGRLMLDFKDTLVVLEHQTSKT